MDFNDDGPEIHTRMLVCDGSSGDVDIERAMASLMTEAFEIFKMKQSSYGHHNISRFGERGVIVRMSDKLSRLVNLRWNDKENKIADERVEDTYLDSAVYALIGILVHRGIWPYYVEPDMELS